MKKLLLVLAALLLASSASFALPNLYVNGSAIAGTPVAGPGDDLIYGASGGWESIIVTLLYEVTPHASKNTLYWYDLDTPGSPFVVLDDNDGVGTSFLLNLTPGEVYAHSLLNDLNDNGLYDPANDEVWLNSIRSSTLPSSSGYQWFRTYVTESYGFASYFFGDGGGDLSFSGDYDALYFIDDDHVTGPNYDHNDLVYGIKKANGVVPEPTTLLLLGLGLTGAGVFRGFKK